MPAREDTRDVLIGRRLADLRDGYGSAPARPAGPCSCTTGRLESGIALEVVPIRGNVDTRIGLVSSG